MKRASIAAGIVIACIVASAGPSSAAERRQTSSVGYTRPHEINLFVGAAGGAAAGFKAPWWAKSVEVSIRDETGRPVAYKARLNEPGWANDGSRSWCSDRTHKFAVPTSTKRVFVQTEGPFGGCFPLSIPTRGVITATFSSLR